MLYKLKKHIPPGGNYYCETIFLTSPKQIQCSMIAAAFADFRTYWPFFTPYSERSDYYSFFSFGGIYDENEYNK